MADQQIHPDRITKPIQLLAAWLTGLVLVDSAFLTAASLITIPGWAAGVLVIAAVLNVPVFLTAIFVLQTRFRPELQADAYYSEYLERQYSPKQESSEPQAPKEVAKEVAEHIIAELGPLAQEKREPIERIIAASRVEDLTHRLGGNRSLTEIYVRPELWPNLVAAWKDESAFGKSVEALVANGLVEFAGPDPADLRLTDVGRQVAERAEATGSLWRDKHLEFFEREGVSLRAGKRSKSNVDSTA